MGLIWYVCRLYPTGDKHTISTFFDQTHIQRTRPRRKTVFFKTSLRVKNRRRLPKWKRARTRNYYFFSWHNEKNCSSLYVGKFPNKMLEMYSRTLLMSRSGGIWSPIMNYHVGQSHAFKKCSWSGGARSVGVCDMIGYNKFSLYISRTASLPRLSQTLNSNPTHEEVIVRQLSREGKKLQSIYNIKFLK